MHSSFPIFLYTEKTTPKTDEYQQNCIWSPFLACAVHLTPASVQYVSVFASTVCSIRLPRTSALYVCSIRLPRTSALCVCSICLLRTSALYVCLVRSPRTSALYVCPVRLPYTSAPYVCCPDMFTVRFLQLIVFGYMMGLLPEALIIAASMHTNNIFMKPFNQPIKSFAHKLMWDRGQHSDLIASLNAYKVRGIA